MIGPPSGGNEMPSHDENPLRLKRRNFDDLDIESFCEEICQSNGKRQVLHSEPLEVATTEVVHTSQFPAVTDDADGAPVARLEVLVVDGTWDVSNLHESSLIDLSASEVQALQALEDVQGVENGFNTILSYWEPTADAEVQCANITPPEPPKPVVQYNPIEDQENINLSWLLDFKLDSFIGAPEDKSLPSTRRPPASRTEPNSYVKSTRGNFVAPETTVQEKAAHVPPDNRGFSGPNFGGPKKPPFTYTELIEHALRERGELTVSAIYQWISEHFPYYKSNDDRWKNSVRHNLSINPHFRKGSKAPHGAGHLWAIANRDMRPRQLITNISSQRSIGKAIPELPKNPTATRSPEMIDEVAAATASILPSHEDDALGSVTLEHCAEQILSGIKREVEVQYLLPMAEAESRPGAQLEQRSMVCDAKDTDFLNPVSKEVVAEECGLIGESFLVTDLNPAALGLNMNDHEVITSDHLFGEELSFQFYELTSPSQMQSA